MSDSSSTLLPNLNKHTPWAIIDNGSQVGNVNMEIDRAALEAMNSGRDLTPTLRFFQWDKPTVSYGYLLESSFRHSLNRNPEDDVVRRPTGGGVVFHQITDLSVSLVWPRRHGIFPERPSECYRIIHERLMTAIKAFPLPLGEGGRRPGEGQAITLFSPSPCPLPPQDGSAEADPKGRGDTPMCYEQPVCNDVMIGDKKIIGGALRLTRNAILYQGNILLETNDGVEELKESLAAALTSVYFH